MVGHITAPANSFRDFRSRAQNVAAAIVTAPKAKKQINMGCAAA